MPTGTILVVDDEPNIRETVALALQDEGYHVLQATDGDALEIARVEQPDMLLLDVNMPGMDGIEVSQRIRHSSVTAHIPIIGMSAAVARGLRDGMIADDWLHKPFDLDTLYQIVARWLRGM